MDGNARYRMQLAVGVGLGVLAIVGVSMYALSSGFSKDSTTICPGSHDKTPLSDQDDANDDVVSTDSYDHDVQVSAEKQQLQRQASSKNDDDNSKSKTPELQGKKQFRKKSVSDYKRRVYAHNEKRDKVRRNIHRSANRQDDIITLSSDEDDDEVNDNGIIVMRSRDIDDPHPSMCRQKNEKSKQSWFDPFNWLFSKSTSYDNDGSIEALMKANDKGIDNNYLNIINENNVNDDYNENTVFTPAKVNLGVIVDTPDANTADFSQRVNDLPPLHPSLILDSFAGKGITGENSKASSLNDSSNNSEVDILSRPSSGVSDDETYVSDQSTSRRSSSSFSKKTLSALKRAKKLPIRRILEVKRENVHLYNRCLNEIGSLLLPYILKKRFRKLLKDSPFIVKMELLKGTSLVTFSYIFRFGYHICVCVCVMIIRN